MRRPLVVVLAIVCAWAAPARAQKLVFVARHAERADEPARNQTDPDLSAAGQARAAKLRVMLGDAGINAIYVTQFKRTQETAKPLVDKLGLRAEMMPISVGALVTTLKSRHPNDIVLLVAHSTTIPAIVKELSGKIVQLPESDYTSLFVVVPASGTVSRLRY